MSTFYYDDATRGFYRDEDAHRPPTSKPLSEARYAELMEANQTGLGIEWTEAGPQPLFHSPTIELSLKQMERKVSKHADRLINEFTPLDQRVDDSTFLALAALNKLPDRLRDSAKINAAVDRYVEVARLWDRRDQIIVAVRQLDNIDEVDSYDFKRPDLWRGSSSDNVSQAKDQTS